MNMRFGLCFGVLGAAGLVAHAADSLPGVVFDTKPAFMQVLTNYSRVTNAVVVTNYVVITNAVVVTNLYNAAGQLLQPVDPAKPPIPGLVPIPQAAPAPAAQAAPKPAAPDPAAIKAAQLAGIKELLVQSLTQASNQVAVAGAFAEGKGRSIPLPEGMTSFDRKKTAVLLTTLNAAAEKLAPVMAGKVGTALAGFNPADPAALIKGGKDAATTAFTTAEGANLSTLALPLAQQAAVDAGVREAYRNAMLKGGGLLGAVLGTGPAVDIDAYLAKSVLDSLLGEVASQEAAIRADPGARKTKALQEAFKP